MVILGLVILQLCSISSQFSVIERKISGGIAMKLYLPASPNLALCLSAVVVFKQTERVITTMVSSDRTCSGLKG